MKGITRMVAVLAIAGLLFGGTVARADEMRGLGDLGFDPVEYASALKDYPAADKAATPSSFDWRNYGVVTAARDQGRCGSCWAFAVVGVMESKIAIAGGPLYDLSEQQQVSCNQYMAGCCGGSYTALQYWYTNNPVEELCTGYDDFTTSCSQPEVTCGRFSCTGVPYNSSGLFTINTNDVEAVKTSILQDGPAYFRFDVHSDFYTYWSSAVPGSVYTETVSGYVGGHAILIIGWDDAKQAWLCKNSWGANAGPNNDGTLWMAWSGHAEDLSFGMANTDLVTINLTAINLATPSNESISASVPTFHWAPNGGTNNVYAVDFALSLSGPVYSSYGTLSETVDQNNWTMPTWVWDMIPSGSFLYWRVRGADLDVTPLNIVTSSELWWVYKP